MIKSSSKAAQASMGLFLLLGLLLLGFFLGEIYVRISNPEHILSPGERREQSLQMEPALFARYSIKPGGKTVQGPNRIRWTINDRGYRGKGFTADKPDGKIRVMVYGGTAAFDGANIEGEDWPHRVENLLRQAGLPQVEVINAGLPDHASFDALGRFFAEGHFYRPDVVLLYSGWEDLPYLWSSEPLLRQVRPYQPYKDPRIQYAGVFDRFFGSFSQLYLLLRDGYYIGREDGFTSPRPFTDQPSDRIAPSALRQFRLDVELFVDLARNIDAIPVLVLQSRLAHPDNKAEDVRKLPLKALRLEHLALCQVLDQLDAVVREIALKKNVRLIDSSSRFNGRSEFFADAIQLNPAGSKALAYEVAPVLTEVIKTSLSSAPKPTPALAPAKAPAAAAPTKAPTPADDIEDEPDPPTSQEP